MLDDDIQRELLRDTVDPERALSIAVNMEMGNQNQQRISSNNNNSAADNTINAIQSYNRFRGASARGNPTGRVAVNPAPTGHSKGCGQAWTTTHRQVCPALGKKRNPCGLSNHFAKVCRKKLNFTRNSRQGNRNNNVETAETTEQITNSENQILIFVDRIRFLFLQTTNTFLGEKDIFCVNKINYSETQYPLSKTKFLNF